MSFSVRGMNYSLLFFFFTSRCTFLRAGIRCRACAQVLCKEYDLYRAPVSLLHGSERRLDYGVLSDSKH